MSGGGVDDLIDELFPEKRHGGAATSSAGHPGGRRQSEWDDEDDDGSGKDSRTVTKPDIKPGRLSASATAPFEGKPRLSIGHTFDDTSSEDDGEPSAANNSHHTPHAPTPKQSSPQQRGGSGSEPKLRRGMSSPVMHPVPFPSLSSSEGSFACASRCFLTNLGAVLKGEACHPTLAQLRDLAGNERPIAGATRAQAMLKKGAFHAYQPKLGNGCLDHRGDCTSDGGCPHILCRKCNYLVVRLQNAAWDDQDGTVNLYLTLRNYYPDWCRLASATPVGVDDSRATARPVLTAKKDAAAYCCQCSWVTVTAPKAVIETKLTDAFMAKPEDEARHAFATQMPLPSGEKRRPPLWVCHGHPR